MPIEFIIWAGGVFVLWAVIAFLAGKDDIEGDDWWPLAVFAAIWPILLGAAIVVAPFVGCAYLGKLARRKK